MILSERNSLEFEEETKSGQRRSFAGCYLFGNKRPNKQNKTLRLTFRKIYHLLYRCLQSTESLEVGIYQGNNLSREGGIDLLETLQCWLLPSFCNLLHKRYLCHVRNVEWQLPSGRAVKRLRERLPSQDTELASVCDRVSHGGPFLKLRPLPRGIQLPHEKLELSA